MAGVVGILLASPMLASGRVIFRYIYRKLRDIPPYPIPGQTEAEPTVAVRKRPERAVAENDTSPPEITIKAFQGSRIVRALTARNRAAMIKKNGQTNGNGSNGHAKPKTEKAPVPEEEKDRVEKEQQDE